MQKLKQFFSIIIKIVALSFVFGLPRPNLILFYVYVVF